MDFSITQSIIRTERVYHVHKYKEPDSHEIMTSENEDILIDLPYHKYINLSKFFREFKEMKQEIDKLKKEVEFVKLHNKFKPGGDGYLQAKEEYECLSNINDTKHI